MPPQVTTAEAGTTISRCNTASTAFVVDANGTAITGGALLYCHKAADQSEDDTFGEIWWSGTLVPRDGEPGKFDAALTPFFGGTDDCENPRKHPPFERFLIAITFTIQNPVVGHKQDPPADADGPPQLDLVDDP